MKYKVTMREGSAIVEAHGFPWWPGQGDGQLRQILRELHESGVKYVVLDQSTVRRLAPGLRVEVEEWTKKFMKSGGGLVLVSGDDSPAGADLALSTRTAGSEEEAAAALRRVRERQTETTRMRIAPLFTTARHKIFGTKKDEPAGGSSGGDDPKGGR